MCVCFVGTVSRTQTYINTQTHPHKHARTCTHRRKRIKAREALRKAEEEFMEQRRKELLSDKDGYWHQRMRMEEQVC